MNSMNSMNAAKQIEVSFPSAELDRKVNRIFFTALAIWLIGGFIFICGMLYGFKEAEKILDIPMSQW